jgi:hypothetical protein
MPLTAGDIAIVGFNSDDPDKFAFVALTDIAAGEVISFTDNGWLAAGGFRSGEGTVSWTAPVGGVTAGTVITWEGGVGFSVGSGGTGGPLFSASGDQLIAYQGPAATPTLLYAVNDEGAGWQADATSSNTSALPTGLVNGDTAVALPELDNYAYTGPTSGTKAELLAAIGNPANWTGGDTLPAGAFPTSFTVGGGGGATVSIAAVTASAAEGDAGSTIFSFTVTRSDGSGAASVDFDLANIGGAGQADAGDFTGTTSGTVNFADGETTATIDIEVLGDTSTEPNETFSVALSNASAGLTIATGTANATILNDDIVITRIYDIQGARHESALAGQVVTTNGIVTAVVSNGFYIQDPTGDGNIATSDGIFVFTSSAPGVSVGMNVNVGGTVTEFRPGGASSNNLTITELTAPTVTVLSSGNPVPLATLIGEAGRLPPLAVINDEATGAFDPANFDAVNVGLDFYESLEGMLIGLDGAVSVSPTNSFDEIWVATVGDAVSDNDRGGVTISEGDFNPQRVQIDNLTGSVSIPDVHVGATFGYMEGVMSYSFGEYEVLLASAPTVASASEIARETTEIAAGVHALTFGSINVENLDPGDAPSKFATLAEQIAVNLNGPTIVALQEIQDNSGPTNDGVTAADITAQMLIDAIIAAGGPTYTYVDVPPANNTSGGEPSGNIRVGFLYRADVATLTDIQSLDVPAFDGSRDPLVATFDVNGETFTFINNHFSSKGGDTGLYEKFQPPVLNSEAARIAQAQVVNDHVDGLLAADEGARVVVLGDLNDFTWSTPLKTLDGTAGGGSKVLYELGEEMLEDAAERYSYVFRGNSQELDHIYASAGALEAINGFDIVHVNAEFYDQASDHDPSVASLFINRAPEAADDQGFSAENKPKTFALLDNDSDPDGDQLSLVDFSVTAVSGLALSTEDAEAAFAIDGNQLVFSPGTQFDALNPGQTATVTVSYLIDDGYGGSDEANFVLTVHGAPETASNVSGTPGDDMLFGSEFNDSIQGRAGSDLICAGGGNDIVNGGAGDDEMEGGAGIDTLTYKGATNPGEGVTVTLGSVRGQDTGGAGFDIISGFENLEGTIYNDVLSGDDGGNKILGLAGDDEIRGGGGNDDMTGGAGSDTFVFEGTESNGVDRIRGFATGEDKLLFFESDGYAADAGFTAGTGAVGGGAQFIFDDVLDRLYYDADGAGGADKVLLANFATLPAPGVQAGDIIVSALVMV